MSTSDGQAGDLGADEPGWLALGRELGSIAQIGLTFSRDNFDIRRYERIRELAAAIVNGGLGRVDPDVLGHMQSGTGYATPKVDVRGAVFAGGRVLLVREISDGLWTLPGGWADVNQTPSESVVREIREESGFEARAVKLAAVHDFRRRNRPHHLDSIYKLFFVCELLGGSATASDETSEAAFFERDSLPPLSTGRATAGQIHRMFEHAAEPGLPTDFD